MQIFKTSRAYLIVFCLYIFNALNVCYPLKSSNQATQFVRSSHFAGINILGGIFCLIIFAAGVRKTSYLIEKCIIVFSGIFFVMFIADNIHNLGYTVAFSTFNRPISVFVICVAAVLSGIRLLQVSKHKNTMT